MQTTESTWSEEGPATTITIPEGMLINATINVTRALGRSIWVTFQKEGIHKYPAALEDPALAEVSFLGYPHRHIFHFRVEVAVTHNDRDIEFILFKRELENLYSDGIMQMDHKSCEMLAEDLISYITKQYPNREVKVTVSEDGENGATLISYV